MSQKLAGIPAAAFMAGLSCHGGGFRAIPEGPEERKPFHGEVRNGRIFDASCAYGGGFVSPDVWEIRERARSADWRM